MCYQGISWSYHARVWTLWDRDYISLTVYTVPNMMKHWFQRVLGPCTASLILQWQGAPLLIKYTNTEARSTMSLCFVTHSLGLCMELALQWRRLGPLRMRSKGKGGSAVRRLRSSVPSSGPQFVFGCSWVDSGGEPKVFPADDWHRTPSSGSPEERAQRHCWKSLLVQYGPVGCTLS